MIFIFDFVTCTKVTHPFIARNVFVSTRKSVKGERGPARDTPFTKRGTRPTPRNPLHIQAVLFACLFEALGIFEIQSTPSPRAFESYKLRWSPSLPAFAYWETITKPLPFFTSVFFNLYVIRIDQMEARFFFSL